MQAGGGDTKLKILPPARALVKGVIPPFNPPSLRGFMIYQLKHNAIGRTTHKAGTAGAAIRYITRKSACSYSYASQMPAERWKAKHWINKQELEKTRKNGRVCDRVMLCLPIELSEYQRIALVHDFMFDLTDGKVPFFFAIHDMGKDANNPHCHIIRRDNCPKTGKKVLQLSKSYSTYRLHDLWRKTLAKWGFYTSPSSKETKKKYKRAKPKEYYYRPDADMPKQTQAKNAFNVPAGQAFRACPPNRQKPETP